MESKIPSNPEFKEQVQLPKYTCAGQEEFRVKITQWMYDVTML